MSHRCMSLWYKNSREKKARPDRDLSLMEPSSIKEEMGLSSLMRNSIRNYRPWKQDLVMGFKATQSHLVSSRWQRQHGRRSSVPAVAKQTGET